MSIIRMRDMLYSKLDLIDDSGIREFTREALVKAPSEFWDSPSGAFHPPENNGKCGLVRHTLKAVQVAYNLGQYILLDPLSRDIAVAGAMLHDVKRGGEPWNPEGVHKEHGKIAYEWLGQFELKDEMVKEDIRNCVRYHMRQYVHPDVEVSRALNPTATEHVVQIADYLASRNDINFLPGVKLTTSQIKDYRL